MSPSEAAIRARCGIVLAAVLALQLAGASIGYFHADDWTNLNHARLLLTPRWAEVWTGLNRFTFYRPIVDVYHAVLLRIAGLHATPHLIALITLLVLQSLLLGRLVRERGGPPAAAWLAATAACVQLNAVTWTTLWPSNATGSLMTLFVLLAFVLHHRAVRGARRGAAALAPVALATLAALLCKEETALAALVLAWLEIVRWRDLSAGERRTAVASWLTLTGTIAAYAVFRLTALPIVRVHDPFYTVHLGLNWVKNLAWFAAHLGALPVTMVVLSRVAFPSAWAPAARRGEGWHAARREMLAGLGWAFLGIQVFLLMGGHGYGYLYAPSFGIALAVGNGLAWASGTAPAGAADPGERAAPGRAGRAPWLLAVHGALAAAVSVAGLWAVAWPQYRPLMRGVFSEVDSLIPAPPESARVVVIDPYDRETPAHRSIVSFLFDDAPDDMLDVHFGRFDLRGVVIHPPLADSALRHPPQAYAVFLARRGRLIPLVLPPQRPGAASGP